MAANFPFSPIRDGRHGHDQNKKKLWRDINIGFNEFSLKVEIIRLLQLDEELKPEEEQNAKLLFDFIKFRDIMAHKPPYNIVLIQMVSAFVIFCRGILNFTITSHEPQSTQLMSNSFARMADINVLVCAMRFIHLNISKHKIVRWMNIVVKKSSFADLKFIVNVIKDHNGQEYDTIFVKPGDKELDDEWLDKLEKDVMESKVTYTEREIQVFKDCIDNAPAL